jgi:elongation factor Tu
VGHFSHGKSTLTAAILARQAYRFGGRMLSYTEIANGPALGVPQTVLYQTTQRYYEHLDCLTRYVDNLLTDAARFACVILVVAADEGAMPLTRQHLLVVRQMGVSGIVAFLSKIDLVDDPQLLNLVEMELRKELCKYGFPGDEIPIIRGNSLPAMQSGGQDDATCKCIDDLMDALDSYIPAPECTEDKPFLMAIEDVFSIKGRGTVGTGRIERGKVKVGDEVEIVGLMKNSRKTTVTGVEMPQKTLDYGMAGEYVGVLLRGVERTDLERGQVLAKPGSITPHTKFNAEVYVLSRDEGGRHTPLFTGYRPQFRFRTTDVTGTVTLPQGVDMCMPGGNIKITVKLADDSSIAMEESLPFFIKQGGVLVACGSVTRTVE